MKGQSGSVSITLFLRAHHHVQHAHHVWSLAWWTTARVTALFAFVAVVAAIGAWLWTQKQLTESRKATQLDGMMRVIDMLQNKEMRAYRKQLYTDDELNPASAVYAQAADEASQVFNAIAHLVESNLIDPKLVLDNWGGAIIDVWYRSWPWIEYRRRTQDNPVLWAPFERLRLRAEAHRLPGKISVPHMFGPGGLGEVIHENDESTSRPAE